MHDWAGWLLMIFNFSIVLMWKHVRNDTKVVHAIWFCIFLHHAVAFLNAYVGGVIGTEADARTMHIYAAQAVIPFDTEIRSSGDIISPESGDSTAPNTPNTPNATPWYDSFGNPRVIYTNSLEFCYRTFGVSLLLGNELSVLAFTLSCIVLVKLVSLLDLWRFRIGIVLFFGLLPSSVIFRSVTLRESWQALFFLLFIYWAVRLWKRLGILPFSFMLMSASCMALLHNGLKAFAVYLILASIYWMIFGKNNDVRYAWPAKFLFAGLLVACVIMLAQKMGWYTTVGQGLDAAEQVRHNLAAVYGRTTYGVMLDTSSVLGLVKTIPETFAQYMFAPFPWQVENLKDVYCLLESMLRFILLFFVVFTWCRSSGEVRSYYGFLFIAVLGMEFMWGLGTINWGTATRHHVPGYSVIVLLGAPGLILFMRKLHFQMFGRRKDNTMLPE